MKILIFVICCFIVGMQYVNAQQNTYVADLQELKTIIQKTKSYKSQIRGKKKRAYVKMYNKLLADTVTDANSYQYFHNLVQLVFPVRDNHLAFYQTPNANIYRSRASIDSFVQTASFSQYPAYSLNIDSLKNVLATKPATSVEGIYYYGKYYTVGVFNTKEKEYAGIILNSELNFWTKGQVVLYLYEQKAGQYKAIYAHPYTKNFIFHTIEKYDHQSLVNSSFNFSFYKGVYAKQLTDTNFVNLPNGTPKFSMKNLDSHTQYIAIRTFQTNSITSKLSQNFYDSIKGKLTAPNIILDLRDHEGGANHETKKYWKMLKAYAKKGKIYVIVNNGTLSQGEIFLLKLKRLKNVTVLGQTTKGMLMYGSNYGKTLKLPSQQFAIYPTDMKGPGRLLQYEDNGVKPDIFLNPDKDWLNQVMEVINNIE